MRRKSWQLICENVTVMYRNNYIKGRLEEGTLTLLRAKSFTVQTALKCVEELRYKSEAQTARKTLNILVS